MKPVSLAKEYAKLAIEREAYLRRARDASELTIPSLYTEQGTNGNTTLRENFQSLGARGVNTLAAKIVNAIFPPSLPFFRLSIDDYTKGELVQNESELAQLELVLSQAERVIFDTLESSTLRTKLTSLAKQLVVSGNSLLYAKDERTFRIFSLEHYVVQRDAVGNLLKIITCEQMARSVLEEMGIQIDEKAKRGSREPGPHDQVKIFTGIIYDEKTQEFEITQEVNGVIVTTADEMPRYKRDELPWLALRFITVDGESYGRGYVDEYLGDLRSLEGLSQSVVEAAAASAKVLFLVSPMGQTSIPALAKAANGAFVPGKQEDVNALTLNKSFDLQVAENRIQAITQSLSFAFLMQTALQRQAERVTAEEVRILSTELETLQGGIYSLLAQELQRPLVMAVMRYMLKAGSLPAALLKVADVKIATGTDAIGRGLQLERIRAFIQDISAFGEQALSRIDMDSLIAQIAAARGIETGILKSKETVKQEQDEAEMKAMAQQVVPQLAGQLGSEAISAATGPAPL